MTTSTRRLVFRSTATLLGIAIGALVTLWIAPRIFRRTAPPAVSPLGAPPVFRDVARASGIAFRHENGETGQFHYPEIMGGGVGLFDYDGDGLLDIYFVNGNHLLGDPDAEITNQLYHNEGDGTFRDVTAQARVGDSGFGQGCCTADFDNDGDVDLYVSNFGQDILYRNEGDGTFADVTVTSGLIRATPPNVPDWGQSCTFLDIDRDGWLDLYVQNYLTYDIQIRFEAFVWIGEKKVLDFPSPKAFKGAADRLYRNNRDGTFIDVTEAAGILQPGGKGMGCAALDFDDDGDTDLFVANDSMENFLFRNRGDGTFDEVALAAGVAVDCLGISEASMGVDAGDFDGDGRMDLVTPCIWEQVFTLYSNRGDFFVDTSWAAGLAQPTSSQTGFSPSFLDYDNDGDLDLYFSTGGVRLVKLRSAEIPYDERYGLRDVLLVNDGEGGFVDVSAHAGSHFRQLTIARGTAAGDIDNDGDIDIVVSNLAAEPAVLLNETDGGHWIGLRLVLKNGNRDAIGTSVRVTAGGRTQRFVVHGGVTYLSQSDRRPRFGLGAAGRVERIEITWPDGSQQVLRDVEADRYVTVQQSE